MPPGTASGGAATAGSRRAFVPGHQRCSTAPTQTHWAVRPGCHPAPCWQPNKHCSREHISRPLTVLCEVTSSPDRPGDSHADNSEQPQEVGSWVYPLSQDTISASQQSLHASWDSTPAETPAPTPRGAPATGQAYEEPLYLPRHWGFTDRPGIDLCSAAGAAVVSHLKHATEGIYSLRAVREDGLPQETIIVFEDQDDATRYAGLLEAAMEHAPGVFHITTGEIKEFCAESGYECRLEPHGSLLIPPDFNVTTTDWERSMRLRDGRWAVLEAEPELQSSSLSTQARGTSLPHQPHPQAGTTPIPAAPIPSSGAMGTAHLARYHPSMSNEELESMKASLEKLLP